MKKLLLFFIFIYSPAFADVWIQYDATTGVEVATNSQKVSDGDLAKNGRAQILYTGSGDPFSMMVDVTQNPPVLIPAPPSPAPPASELDLVLNAMVQSGQIDPSTIDQATLSRLNASLAVSGAPTIAVPAKTGGAVSAR